MTYNLALTEAEDGSGLIVHVAHCPDARAEARAGLPVYTMIGCERMPPSDMERHSCVAEIDLENEQDPLFEPDVYVVERVPERDPDRDNAT